MAPIANTKNGSRTQTNHPSALTKFQLSFEYDRSWSEAKQTVQHRPTKK